MRYHRHLVLDDFGSQAQQRLGNAHVTIVGLGGLGSAVAEVLCETVPVPLLRIGTKDVFGRSGKPDVLMAMYEMTAEDMDALYEILIDEETAKYLPAKAGTREEELEKLVSYVSCVYSFFGYGYWGVFSKETGELIGRAGFKEGEYPLEAGYVIKRSEWGRGYATEILSELVRYANEELDCTEIVANIDERNTASLRVAEKCGIICNRLRR